jgi:hypothetical protein
MRLVDAKEGPVALRQIAQPPMKSRIRHDEVAVGHRGLGEHERDVAAGERILQAVERVERQDRGVRRRCGRQTPRIRHAAALIIAYQRRLDVAVVMAAEDHDARPLRHEPGDADDLGIRPRSRQRELPKR